MVCFVVWGADVLTGGVQNEVLEMHELTSSRVASRWRR